LKWSTYWGDGPLADRKGLRDWGKGAEGSSAPEVEVYFVNDIHFGLNGGRVKGKEFSNRKE